MIIERVEVGRERLPLSKPYTIARHTIAAVELFFVRIHAGGASGIGSASPAADVTGETSAACAAGLERAADFLAGKDPYAIGNRARELERLLPTAPAARAALDMALWDLAGQRLGVAVVDLLGRCHVELPTSVTVGIQSTEAAVELARDYLRQGFRVLKVKLGRDVEADVERLRRIREVVGSEIGLRTDPNAGYDATSLRRYLAATRDLGIEFCEQPVARGQEPQLESFADADRTLLAADESVLDLADAARLAAVPRSYGIFNLKLMKCGGITPAQRIANFAHAAGIGLMWGCNDESRVSIAAALHVAFAAPATRYLDLDGSFDLARDLASGGFVLDRGLLRTTDAPGLGASWID